MTGWAAKYDEGLEWGTGHMFAREKQVRRLQGCSFWLCMVLAPVFILWQD